VAGGVERGVVSLRIPERMRQGKKAKGARGNTLDIHDE